MRRSTILRNAAEYLQGMNDKEPFLHQAIGKGIGYTAYRNAADLLGDYFDTSDLVDEPVLIRQLALLLLAEIAEDGE